MKAILEYQLPEEEEEFNIATSGGVYLRVIGQFHDYLGICMGLPLANQLSVGIILETFDELLTEHGVGA